MEVLVPVLLDFENKPFEDRSSLTLPKPSDNIPGLQRWHVCLSKSSTSSRRGKLHKLSRSSSVINYKTSHHDQCQEQVIRRISNIDENADQQHNHWHNTPDPTHSRNEVVFESKLAWLSFGRSSNDCTGRLGIILRVLSIRICPPVCLYCSLAVLILNLHVTSVLVLGGW